MLFLLIAFAGFLDASYLAAKYFLGSPVICNLLKGCEIVTSSKYSVMFGIPIALMGSLYYLALLILTVVFFDTGRSVFLKAAAYGTVFGFIASLYFVYLQFFVIKALCLYCLLSAVSSTVLLVLGGLVIYRSKQNPLSQ